MIFRIVWLIPGFRKYDTCDWQGYHATLQGHCLKEHHNNFYCKQKQKFLAKNFSSITNDHYIFVLIHTYNEFFRLVWELESTTSLYCFFFGPKQFLVNIFILGLTKWSVMYMGSSENAKKFSYKIAFPQLPDEEYTDISRNLTWMAPCGTSPEDNTKKFSGHNYLMIHRYNIHILLNILLINLKLHQHIFNYEFVCDLCVLTLKLILSKTTSSILFIIIFRK